MKLWFATSSVWLGHAANDQTEKSIMLNTKIENSPSGTYNGGKNKGVMVRSPDFFDAGSTVEVLPATFWHNDIYAPSQMYPSVASPWCPNAGSDGFYSTDACTDGPWEFAVVGVVLSDAMQLMWDDFENIQGDQWENGVFYASDGNAADARCVYLADYNGFDCPGGWLDFTSGQFTKTDIHFGAGAYLAGNPYKKGFDKGGGGAGCHFEGGVSAIDQPDAFDNTGSNLVENANCMCNSAFKGHWDSWVENLAFNTVQKSGFEERDWLNAHGKKAPSWALDTAACWLTNPRDLIQLQNELYWKRALWSNELVPQSDWSSGDSREIRKYWGWNEIPVGKGVIDDATMWDSIIVKLPADTCQTGDWGVHDDPSCLSPAAQQQLEQDLDQFVQNGKLVPGVDHVSERPGSYVLFVREYADSSLNWQRKFFCSNWVSPNFKYQVVYGNPNHFYQCYIEAGAPAPAPTPPATAIMNVPTGLCLQADTATNGQVVTARQCDGQPHQQWTYSGGQVTHGSPGNPHIFCLDATDQTEGNTLILWDCLGNDQQHWLSDGSAFFVGKVCMDLAPPSPDVQIWNCAEGNTNQMWSLGPQDGAAVV